MKVGTRIYYNNFDGSLLCIKGDRSGNVSPNILDKDINTLLPNIESKYISFIDFKYGEYTKLVIENKGKYLEKIDVSTKKLIWKDIIINEPSNQLTEKDKYIQKLEKQNADFAYTIMLLGGANELV